MPQMTLLQMTQDILSNLSSDTVNSISDTAEATQVATIIKQKYYDIINRGDLPENYELFQLTASGDITKPTLMFAPDNLGNIKWIKYFNANVLDTSGSAQLHDINDDLSTPIPAWNTASTTSVTMALGHLTFTVGAGLSITVNDNATAQHGASMMFGTVYSYSGTTLILNVTSMIGSGTYNSWIIASTRDVSVPGYQYVTVLPIDQFLDYVNRLNPTNSAEVGSYLFTEGGNTFPLYFRLNQQPQYCTVLENYYILFDAYDSTLDSTLQASKTLVFGEKLPIFTFSDSFTPDLDNAKFGLLMNEAKALAFYELKQQPHPYAQQEIKRGWSSLQRDKAITKENPFNQLPDFGRVPRSGGFSGGGYGAYKWMRQAGP